MNPLLTLTRESIWWGGRRLTVVAWIEGVSSGAGLLRCGHAVCCPLVWLGDSGWIPPHCCPTDPTKMFHIPTSLSPLDPLSGFTLRSWGPGILWRHFRVSQVGCWSKQLASGPPDLAWTRTALVYLNLGTFIRVTWKEMKHTQNLLSGKVGKERRALYMNRMHGYQLVPLLSIVQLLSFLLKELYWENQLYEQSTLRFHHLRKRRCTH